MFGSKAKKLEETLAQRNLEAEGLLSRIAEMERRLATYAQKEEAIIGALTDAKTTATRIIAAAEKTRDDMLFEGEQKRRLACEEAGRALCQAHERAEIIEREAAQKAAKLLFAAEEELASYRETLRALNLNLRQTAQNAREHALSLEAFLHGQMTGDDGGEVESGFKALRARIGQEAYENEQAPCEPVEPVYETELLAAEGDAALQEDDEQSERVWTVDEILQSGVVESARGIKADEQLNELIDEVLFDS